MSEYSTAVVGTGDPDEGAGMAYYHGDAYEDLDECNLVACVDVVPERAATFAAEYDLPEENAYEDYETMVTEVCPDIVSITVSPGLHAELVVGTARTGIPDAIHCEKPMADAWGESRLMAQECWRRDIQLTFNHQRRFGAAWQDAKTYLNDGTVGDLQRVETSPPNLFDWGTHAIDLCNYFTDDSPADWVLGNIDYHEERRIFDVHHEDQALASWRYENGIYGLASTGAGSDAVDAFTRLIGDGGTIEVNIQGRVGERYDAQAGRAGIGEYHTLRVRRDGEDGWQERSYEDEWVEMTRRGIGDLITALDDGREPQLSSRRALGGTEIIFGAYESARQRGRIDFPLDIKDHPLETMVENGLINPMLPDQ